MTVREETLCKSDGRRCMLERTDMSEGLLMAESGKLRSIESRDLVGFCVCCC